MKHILLIAIILFISTTLFSQVPEKMSYQAVVRDLNGGLLQNKTLGIQVSVLHGDKAETALPVYTERHEILSNKNGLVTLEIGTGISSFGDFSSIEWTTGDFFLKTEIDHTGGTTYSITGITPILSVPFALHAQTASAITGEIDETDPDFNASVAAGITQADITKWDNASVGEFTETDPVFMKSQAANITDSDIINLENLSGINTGDQDISGIIENAQALIDTASQLRASIPDASDFVLASEFIENETDPVFGTSVAFGITTSDTAKWNAASVGEFTEEDPGFNASAAAGITQADITKWNNASVGEFSETDPVFIESQAANITDSDIINLENLSGINTGDQDISGIIENAQALVDTASQLRASIPDVSDFVLASEFIENETDPVFGTSVAFGITTSDTAKWNAASVGEFTELDPIFSLAPAALITNAGSGVVISTAERSKLSGLNENAEENVQADWNETDNTSDAFIKNRPTNVGAFTNDVGYLRSETDPDFNAWDKSTGIMISEKQITDLQHFTSADETDPVFDTSVAAGITQEDTARWNSNNTIWQKNGDVAYYEQEVAIGTQSSDNASLKVMGRQNEVGISVSATKSEVDWSDPYSPRSIPLGIGIQTTGSKYAIKATATGTEDYGCVAGYFENTHYGTAIKAVGDYGGMFDASEKGIEVRSDHVGGSFYVYEPKGIGIDVQVSGNSSNAGTFIASGEDATALTARATATEGENVGGYFEVNSRQGAGIKSISTYNTWDLCTATAGYFESVEGTTIKAVSTSTKGGFTAGEFEAKSSGGIAVRAIASSASGYNTGGYFTSASNDGTGIYSVAPMKSGSFKAHGGAGAIAVYGIATSTTASGNTMGGWFESNSANARAIYARANSSSKSGTPVAGFFRASASANGIGVQSVGGSGGYDFYAAGSGVHYGQASSKRWKRNIKEIDKPLEKIAKIRGVYYDWDEEHGGHHDLGCIAEEVGAVLPEIVAFEKNGIDASGMDYSKLTPLLIEATKALLNEIEELKVEKNTLQKQNENILSRLEKLEILFEMKLANK